MTHPDTPTSTAPDTLAGLTLLPCMLAEVHAERLARTRRHADHCIQLAVVTSADVAATLIDHAVALRARLRLAAGGAHL